MSNSTESVGGLIHQQVKDGFWALNAYTPVFWCPFRSSACLEGTALTVDASPCEYPSQGYFCQDVNHQGVYLDIVSRQMEDCTESMTSWFPISVILSAGMLAFLLYISCWKVCKLERISLPNKQHQQEVNLYNSSAPNSIWSLVRSHFQRKQLMTMKNTKDIEQVDSHVDGVTVAESNGTLSPNEKASLSCYLSVCGLFNTAKASESVQYKLNSWPILEWLAEFHLLLMSYQIISSLPASFYTAFPPLTTHVLRILSHISLASPTTWPFSCFSSDSNRNGSIIPWPTFHFWNIMTLTTTVPIVLFLCITCLYVFLYELYFLASNEKRRRRGQERLSTWFFTACVSGYCILIGSVAQLTIGSLNCVDVDPDKSTFNAETNVLWQDPTLVCAGSSYTYYRIWASLSIIIYLFFIPMTFGASVRCWRCTISVILNHAHRFSVTPNQSFLPIADTQEQQTQSKAGIKGFHTSSSPAKSMHSKHRCRFEDSEEEQTCSDNSHSSDSSLSSKASSTYFLVTRSNDVAQLNQHRYDDEHVSSSSYDNEMSDLEAKGFHQHMKRNELRITSKSDVNDKQPLVHVKVSRTVRAAALLYTNFRPQYKYGILLEIFVRVFYMGILPNVANPVSSSPTQALTLPFIGAVAACFLWMLLLKGKPYRRSQVQRLAELTAIQVLLFSLAAMLLQLEEFSSSYVESFSSSAWLLLDLVLMCVLLIPTGYYVYHQWVASNSLPKQSNTTTELASSSIDTASLSHHSDLNDDRKYSMSPRHGTFTKNQRKFNNWSPEYQWLRDEFQRSHGLTQSLRPHRGMLSPSVFRKHGAASYDDYTTSRNGDYFEQQRRSPRHLPSMYQMDHLHSSREMNKEKTSRHIQLQESKMYASMYFNDKSDKQRNRRNYSLSPSSRRREHTNHRPYYSHHDDFSVISESSNVISLPTVYRHALHRAEVPYLPPSEPLERSASSNSTLSRSAERRRQQELYTQTQPHSQPELTRSLSRVKKNNHVMQQSVEDAVSDCSTAEEDEFFPELPHLHTQYGRREFFHTAQGRKQVSKDKTEEEKEDFDDRDEEIPPPPSSPTSSSVELSQRHYITNSEYKAKTIQRDTSVPLHTSPSCSRSDRKYALDNRNMNISTPKLGKPAKSPRTPPTRELYDSPRSTPSSRFEAKATKRNNDDSMVTDMRLPKYLAHSLQVIENENQEDLVTNDCIGRHVLNHNRSWFHEDGNHSRDRKMQRGDRYQPFHKIDDEEEEHCFEEDVFALPTLSASSSIKSRRLPILYDQHDTLNSATAAFLTSSSNTMFL